MQRDKSDNFLSWLHNTGVKPEARNACCTWNGALSAKVVNLNAVLVSVMLFIHLANRSDEVSQRSRRKTGSQLRHFDGSIFFKTA